MFSICNSRIVLLALCLLLATTTPAHAGQDGIGIVAGAPTGVSYKNWTGKQIAYQFGAGWDLAGHDRLAVTADKLFHTYGAIPVSSGSLPYYWGIGGFVASGDDAIGVRFPLGLNYLFGREPFDVAVEIIPHMTLLPGTHFFVDAAFALRYHF